MYKEKELKSEKQKVAFKIQHLSMGLDKSFFPKPHGLLLTSDWGQVSSTESLSAGISFCSLFSPNNFES